MPFSEPSGRLAAEVAGLLKRIALLPRSLRPMQVDLVGPLREGGGCFRLTYLGEGESLPYLRELYFAEIREADTTTFPLASLAARVRRCRSTGALAVVEINRLLRSALPAGGFLTFPWIRQRIVLHSRAYLARRGKIEGTFGRRVRKYRYTCSTTCDERSVEVFYERLYAPYIESRYGACSHPRSLGELKAAVARGLLLQVYDGDEWVSAALCRATGRELAALAFGLAPDYDRHLHRGALSAAYYFMLQYAQESGLDTVDLLRCRPHAGDGVFEHKRRWGAQPEIDPWPHTCLGIFLPDRGPLPPTVGEHLVWDGRRFVKLQDLAGREPIRQPARPL